MPRTKTSPFPVPRPGSAPPAVVDLLTKAAVASLEDTDEVVAMLENLRRLSPRDYIAACVAIARLGVEVPATAATYNVISAIPRSRLDELPPHMAQEQERQIN